MVSSDRHTIPRAIAARPRTPQQVSGGSADHGVQCGLQLRGTTPWHVRLAARKQCPVCAALPSIDATRLASAPRQTSLDGLSYRWHPTGRPIPTDSDPRVEGDAAIVHYTRRYLRILMESPAPAV